MVRELKRAGMSVCACCGVMCVVAVAGPVHSVARADTFVWIGGQSLNWNQAQNWQPGQVPGVDEVGADAIVSQAKGVVQATAWMTLGDLITEVPVRFWGITATVNTATVRDLILQNATFDVQDVLFDGTTVWNYGMLQGSPGSPAVNQGTMLFPTGLGTGTKEIRRKTLTNMATVEQFGGISLTADGEIQNEGQWNLYSNNSGFSNFTPGLGGAMFKNAGTLTRHQGNPPGATGGSNFAIPFENTGNVVSNGQGADISFHHSGKVGGSYNVSGGGLIRFSPLSGHHDVDGQVDFGGNGEIRIASAPGNSFRIKPEATLAASVNPAGTGLGFHITGSYPIIVDGIVQNSGTMHWSSGSFEGQGEINNTGLVNLAGGSPLGVEFWNMDGGAVYQTQNLLVGSGIDIQNEANATWRMAGGVLGPVGGSTGNRLVNHGTFKRDGGQGNLFVSLPLLLLGGAVENHGPLGGKLIFTGGGELAGNVKFRPSPNLAGADIVLDGPQVYRVTGDPRVEFTPFETGSLRIGPGTELRTEGGTFSNDGQTVVLGAITTTSGGGFLNNGHLWFGNGAAIGTASNPNGIVRNTKRVTINFFGGVTTIRGTLINAPTPENGIDQTATVQLHGMILNESGTYLLAGTIAGNGSNATFHNKAAGRLVTGSDKGLSSLSGTTLLNNEGRVEVWGGSLNINQCLQVQNGALTGGTWVILPGATLNLPQGITHVATNTKIELNGGQVPNFAPNTIERGAEVQVGDGAYQFPPITNSGAVTVQPGGTLGINGPGVNEGGVIQILPGGHLESQGPLNNEEDDEGILGEIEEVLVYSLIGDDRGIAAGAPQPMITAPVLNNNAILRPGGLGAPGPFNLTGDLNQLPGGIIHIELGGAAPIAEHDQMRLFSGDAHLAGTLAIVMLDEYEPTLGQSFDILVLDPGMEVTGAFDNVLLPDGMMFSVTYHDDRVSVAFDGTTGPPCTGDLNTSGAVDVQDLLILLSAWGPCGKGPGTPGSCPADLNDSGAVDVQDLLILLGAWGPCP